jgi:hypothetical protein
MPEVQRCTKCGRIIGVEKCSSSSKIPIVKNPNPNQPSLFFHHRVGGNCYWEYLRDQVLKVQGHRREHIQKLSGRRSD